MEPVLLRSHRSESGHTVDTDIEDGGGEWEDRRTGVTRGRVERSGDTMKRQTDFKRRCPVRVPNGGLGQSSGPMFQSGLHPTVPWLGCVRSDSGT